LEEPVDIVHEKRWKIAEPDAGCVKYLAGEDFPHPLLVRLLANRGISDPVEAARFVAPALDQLHDPFLLKDMDRAAYRLTEAVMAGEKICVYGDYDVDGVTSVALLTGFLREVGADCFYCIPKRLEEGYGLGADGVRKAANSGARLIVTADCGINAFDEAELCASLGLELIITDHHTPSALIPAALAVINPMRPGCAFPFKSLAGVGVAFNLIMALRSSLRDNGFFASRPEPNLRRYLDLVALGTIADIVPLTGQNRILVSHGLLELATGFRTGVASLKKVAGINGKVDCGMVGFRLGPRLNAAGRLDDASVGAELLLTGDLERADILAAELDAANEERQSLEQEILRDALRMLEDDYTSRGRKSIVLASESWHAGVIGIVASRIVDMYHRPTILIALGEDGGKGSGRSIPGFHLYDALNACSEHLLRFGGHKYAAGLTIDRSILKEFTVRFNEVAEGLLEPEDLVPELTIDAIIPPAEITLDTVELLSALEPFGIGNPRPVFALLGVRKLSASVMKGRHVRLRLAAGDEVLEAVGFGMAGSMPDAGLVDIAFTLEINEWNGRKTVRLMLKDVREHLTSGQR
jgi:single-stranded-DNA-specific exonuclease